MISQMVPLRDPQRCESPWPKMDKTNLLMVSNYFSTHRGGIEITAERLCQELATNDSIEVCLAAFAPPAPEAFEDKAARITLGGWNTIERLTGVPFPVPNIRSIRVLWHLVKNADVVMVFETIYLANFFAFLMSRWAKKPAMIVQFVSIIPYRSWLLRGLMSIANRLLVVFAMNRAEQTVFTSANTQKHFEKRTRSRRPHQLIFGGVDTLVFSPANVESKRQLRLSLGISPHDEVCLFVGRFVEKKGIHTLRRLAEKTPEIRWILAGWGPVDPDEWGLRNVRVERTRSGASLAVLYQCADLLVLPSIGEGLPLVIQEALACGLPVLCSTDTAEADPGLKDLLFTESVDADDPDRTEFLWYQKLKLLLNTLPEAFNRNQAINHAIETWSWQQAAEQYHQLLKGLTERP